MPAKRDRETPRFEVLEGGLDFEIRPVGRDIRVSLAGTFDPRQLERVKRAVELRIRDRGRTVILDGSGLDHVDYRCVPQLMAWNREMRAFGHRVGLAGWRSRHKIILLLGADEAGRVPAPTSARFSVV